MTRRSFTVHERAGSQRKAVALLHTPGRAEVDLAVLADGEYTIRDCLGGLRMIVRVTTGEVSIIERTPT